VIWPVGADRPDHVLNCGGVLLELAVGRGDFQVVQRGRPLLQVTTTLPREPSRSVGSQRCGAVRLAATAWTDLARRAPRSPKWRWTALVVVSYAEPIACFGWGRRRRRERQGPSARFRPGGES
jgi:hypothetical protein